MAYDLFTKQTTSKNYAISTANCLPFSTQAKVLMGIGLTVLVAQIARRASERTVARLRHHEPELKATQQSRAISDRDLLVFHHDNEGDE